MNLPSYQQETEIPEQVHSPNTQRSQLELEQLARDIVEDKELLACVLNTVARILETMAPGEGDPMEETARAHSPPPISPARVESQTSQPYHHSPEPSPRHDHPPQFPPQKRENMTEEAIEQQMSAHDTRGQPTPRQLTLGPPTICRSPVEDFSNVFPAASETATTATTAQPTPGQSRSEKPTNGQPISRQPIPGQPRPEQTITGQSILGQPIPGHHRPGHHRPENIIPGLFTPNQPTTVPFSQGQSTPGQYATYHPTPGQWSPYPPPPSQYTSYHPMTGQYTTYHPAPGQYPFGYPTRNQYNTNHLPRNQNPCNKPSPAKETEEEREARELAEYIAFGHDEELKEKYPEHFMRRRADGRWEPR